MYKVLAYLWKDRKWTYWLADLDSQTPAGCVEAGDMSAYEFSILIARAESFNLLARTSL